MRGIERKSIKVSGIDHNQLSISLIKEGFSKCGRESNGTRGKLYMEVKIWCTVLRAKRGLDCRCHECYESKNPQNKENGKWLNSKKKKKSRERSETPKIDFTVICDICHISFFFVIFPSTRLFLLLVLLCFIEISCSNKLSFCNCFCLSYFLFLFCFCNCKTHPFFNPVSKDEVLWSSSSSSVCFLAAFFLFGFC
jgi:hypothetical protein